MAKEVESLWESFERDFILTCITWAAPGSLQSTIVDNSENESGLDCEPLEINLQLQNWERLNLSIGSIKK